MSGEGLVSVVIPTKNSGETLETCLKSIKNQTYSNLEIIIADCYSTDGTKGIVEKFGAKFIECGVGRSEARNIGAREAMGDYILSLDCDMELTAGVVEESVSETDEGFDAIIIPEISVGIGFWSRCKALEKTCYLGDELIEASRFFRRDVFEAVGGYDPKLEAGEDWDIHQRIRNKNFRIGRIDAFIRHHEGKLSLQDTILKKYHYGQTMKYYKTKHYVLARRQLTLVRPAFLRNWRILAEDPIHALGMFFMKTCEFVAGGFGLLVSTR